MRRYLKHMISLMMSFALTFWFFYCLHSWGKSIDHPENDVLITKHKKKTLRDLPNEFHNFSSLPNSILVKNSSRKRMKGGWMLLPGNVPVHVGRVRNPHDYAYVINPESRCGAFDNERTKLLIFILSEVQNSERRQTIRDTWGLLSLQRSLNFRIVFLLGVINSTESQQRVCRENYTYGDIVQENFTESFKHLALKSVMGLKWATSFCQNADFIMKTDDDLFIHVPNLFNAMVKVYKNAKQDTLLCHENRVRHILRKELLKNAPEEYAKYQVLEQDLPGMYFPQYCAGLGYVLPQQVAKKLYSIALITPYFFIEDVYITGICRQKAALTLKNYSGFTLRPIILPMQASCAFRDGRITSQEITTSEMRQIWSEVNTQGFFCPEVVGYLVQN